MSCIIPTRPSKTAVSAYILLFHQFLDFNSCALNSNLNTLFKEVSGSADNDSISSQELTNIEITFTVPNGYKIHSVKQLDILGWSGLLYQGHRISGNTVTIRVYNILSVARPCNISAVVNCIKI